MSFSPGDCPAEWSSDAPIEAIHVYIQADALHGIRDFFGITDPWLAAYCRLLESNRALYDDSLLLEHTQQLLLRHLVRHYSDAARKALEPRARVAPLGRGVIRRIEEYHERRRGDD